MLSDTMMLGGGRKAAYPIDNSLLFRGSQYLTRTPAVEGNRKTFTFNCWFRRSALSVRQRLLFVGGAGDDSGLFSLEVLNDKIQVSGGVSSWRVTTSVLRDVTAWYHVVLAVDTRSQIVDLYINGERVTAFETSNDIPVDLLTAVNSSNVIHYLGRTDSTTTGGGSLNFLQGYMAEPILVDGSALDPSYFGQIDPVTGSWRPKAVSGVDFGTNGFYLGKPWDAANLGMDSSGNPVSYASMQAGTTNSTYLGLTNDGLTLNYADAGSAGGTRTALGMVGGKYYWELAISSALSLDGIVSGICTAEFDFSNYVGYTAGGWGWAAGQARKYHSGSYSAFGSAGAVGGTIMFAYDASAGKLWFGYNGTWMGVSSQSDPANGLNPAYSGIVGSVYPATSCQPFAGSLTYNFGATEFAYTPPAGFNGLTDSWQASGFAASDVMGDSPTNVYATLNPLDQNPSINVLTLSDGNLRCTWTNDDWAVASIWVTAGKWYWEWSCVSRPSYSQMPGITNRLSSIGRPVWSYNGFNGEIFNGSSYLGVSYGTWGAGDIIGMALDMDAGTLSWYKNGVLSTAISGLSGAYAPSVDGNDGVADLNFGQRPFAFTPPDGFQSLCTANLPATTGQTGGTFTGNANADGPCVFTGAVPETLSVNGNAVIWGTHADKLATGFKIRTASSAYNVSGDNTWVATYDRKPTVGPKNRAPANAQGNP
ncbi:SPRY domain-containing protein [Magnetospirillum aberrantis]|uniref:B30.2/SPRY domain-containing protein n=1 Tax=Magnetospirillum aberrantis SpK TaxID=908842 RepID=A0A7C9UX26_9PROT|nr:SPRY domain-containing protein [Magnetospirillum aberrantis]NFV80790.1 hypothetical protein [Magnetospirillum aberrantis SpK]